MGVIASSAWKTVKLTKERDEYGKFQVDNLSHIVVERGERVSKVEGKEWVSLCVESSKLEATRSKLLQWGLNELVGQCKGPVVYGGYPAFTDYLVQHCGGEERPARPLQTTNSDGAEGGGAAEHPVAAGRRRSGGADGGAEATAITAKYDLILRTRPDLCLCKPLDLHQVRLVVASPPPPHARRTALTPRQVHEDTATAVHVPWFNLWEERSPPACNYAFDQIALGRVAPMMRYVNGFANVCEQVRECHSTL